MFSTASWPALGAQPASYTMGTGGDLSERSGREADHLPPSSAEIKNCEAKPSLPHVFMAWCLTKYRDNFTSTFYPD
jgi:hypothetical protein